MCMLCNDRIAMDRRSFLGTCASAAAWLGTPGASALAQDVIGTSKMSITEICDRFIEEFAAVNPMAAGRILGVGRSTEAVTDWSPSGADAAADLMKRTLAALDRTPAVNRAEHLGAGFLRDNAEAILAMNESGEHLRRMSTSLFLGPQAMLLTSFDLMDRAPNDETPMDRPRGESNWERIAARMRAVPKALAGYRQSLEMGMAAGKRASRTMTLAVADQCAGYARQSWFQIFGEGYKAGGPLQAELASAGRAADAAYADLSKWLREVYAPGALAADGIGNERYQLYARLWLGIAKLDLDEAYGWAQEEHARLEREKVKEARRLGAGASFEEARASLDADPSQSIEGVDAFRDWAQGLVDAAIGKLADVEFDIPEKLRRCTVEMTSASGSGAMPFYLAGPEDFSAPANVIWPTLGKTRLPKWNAISTVYHESVPGHHLQLGGSRLLDLTRVQRIGAAAGHCEGWALYAERLMDEMGWFDTPQSRLGFLSLQSFRAARVLVDIGLHTGRLIPAGFKGAGQNWSIPLAVDAIDRASGLGREAAELEVMRYLAWPAQAPCYKLGERTWLAARDAAVAKAGANFNRRKWHADALALGPLGLDRLTTELQRL